MQILVSYIVDLELWRDISYNNNILNYIYIIRVWHEFSFPQPVLPCLLICFLFLFSGAYLEQMYDESVVVAVATIVAILDVLFIIFMVPESLPDKCKPSKSLTLDQVDPFSAMKKIWKDKTILMICLTVFLSYLPEAGQYSCFFVYLR